MPTTQKTFLNIENLIIDSLILYSIWKKENKHVNRFFNVLLRKFNYIIIFNLSLIPYKNSEIIIFLIVFLIFGIFPGDNL